MGHNHRYHQAKRVTLIGAGMNAFLGILKLIGGMVFRSHALVADGLHSFADLVSDGMVLLASKYGSEIADDRHPYGHQRIETAATLILSLLLVLTGAGIIWDSLQDLLHRQHNLPGQLALPIALFSILVNEGLYQYTHRIGKKIRSALVVANAWHHRSDAASSFVVLIGLIGSLFGVGWFDAVAAMIVGTMIMNMGREYAWNSVKELVDTAVDAETLEKISQEIQRVSGVRKIHQLRTRLMGEDIFIDVHILVNPLISVSEGHYIAQHVHHTLRKNIHHVKDVTVHVDPEDDETAQPCIHLPNRQTLEQLFLLPWQQQFPALLYWHIHYLEGQMIFDLYLKSDFQAWDTFHQCIAESLANQSERVQTRIYIDQSI